MSEAHREPADGEWIANTTWRPAGVKKVRQPIKLGTPRDAGRTFEQTHVELHHAKATAAYKATVFDCTDKDAVNAVTTIIETNDFNDYNESEFAATRSCWMEGGIPRSTKPLARGTAAMVSKEAIMASTKVEMHSKSSQAFPHLTTADRAQKSWPVVQNGTTSSNKPQAMAPTEADLDIYNMASLGDALSVSVSEPAFTPAPAIGRNTNIPNSNPFYHSDVFNRTTKATLHDTEMDNFLDDFRKLKVGNKRKKKRAKGLRPVSPPRMLFVMKKEPPMSPTVTVATTRARRAAMREVKLEAKTRKNAVTKKRKKARRARRIEEARETPEKVMKTEDVE